MHTTVSAVSFVELCGLHTKHMLSLRKNLARTDILGPVGSCLPPQSTISIGLNAQTLNDALKSFGMKVILLYIW